MCLQVTFGTEEFSAERWRHFRLVDRYTELCDWLKTGRLDVASCLCSQFADVLSAKLVSCLDNTLAMIPDEVVVADLCAWLSRAIVPHVLEHQDFDVINSLAAWLEKRASDMEVMDKLNWPVNAIQLCDVLRIDTFRSLWTNVTQKEYVCPLVGLALPQTTLEEARQSQNALVRLRTLHSDLQQMIELRNKYNCTLSLAEFRSETVQSLAYRLLDRVAAVELVSTVISDVIHPYAVQNCLQLDKLLSSYVEELVHRRGTGGMNVSPLWESKAIAILASMSSRALSEDTLLAILSAAQFPWSENVSNAVKTALAKNPSHSGLKGQLQLASLKQTLINYDLQRFNFEETTRSTDLAYYILMQDTETAMEDALKVTQVYSNVSQTDVYLFRCCFLAERNRTDEIVCLLRTVTVPTLLADICESFIGRCNTVMSSRLNKLHSEYSAAARHIRSIVTSLSSHCRQDLLDQLSDLDAVYRLESEFGKFISVRGYCITAKRRQFFYDCLSSSSKDQDHLGASAKSVSKNAAVDLTYKTKSVVKRPIKGSERELAYLLKMSPCDKVYRAVMAARDGDIHTAVEIAERVVERQTSDSVDKVRHVVQILKALCESVEMGSAVSVEDLNAVHKISCNLSLSAPSSLLDQCTRVARSTRLAVEMAAQCCTDNSSVADSAGVDPYKQWVFDDSLSDDDCGGLVMDGKAAMPLAFAFIAAGLPSDENIFLLPVAMPQQIVDVFGKLAQLLTANNQTRLFLGYSQEVAAVVGGVSDLSSLHGAIVSTLKQSVFKRRADYKLALTALLSLPEPFAKNTLQKLARSAGIQYKKLLAVSQVGRAFAQLTNNADALSMAEDTVTEARWGYRLAKVHVSFCEFFGGKSGDKQEFICILAAAESIVVKDVIEYCQDMKLDMNDSLCLYLTCLLLPSSDSLNDVPVIPFSVVRQRAEEACVHIKQEKLISTLEKIFEKTSPYDYERQEFIFDQLLSVSPSDDELNRSLKLSTVERDKKLLVCLKSYSRVSPPSEEELSLTTGDTAKERLPLLTLVMKQKRWRIISAELNADTVDLWIPMAALLHLPDCQIYTTAIRNIVQSHVGEVASHAEWDEASVDTEFMSTVSRLLSLVTSTDLAVSCVSWIASELPAGAEKVVVYKWCVSLQDKHLTSCASEERHQAADVLKKYQNYSKRTAIEQVSI